MRRPAVVAPIQKKSDVIASMRALDGITPLDTDGPRKMRFRIICMLMTPRNTRINFT